LNPLKDKFIFGNIFLGFIFMITPVFQSSAYAQEISAKAGMDTSTILLGQQVTLKIDVSLPKNKTLSWPVFTDSVAPGVEIVSTSAVDTVETSDPQRVNLTQRIRITSFDTGFHTIPSIPFYENGKRDSLHILAMTNELFLTVNTVAVDTTRAIKDIKGVMSVPLTFWEVFRWVLLGLAIVFLVFAVWYYIHRRRKNKPVFVIPSRPSVPPHVQALGDLEKLRQAKLWQTGKVKEYHTRLTDILRIYIEKRFNIQAMEMTTDDTLETMKTLLPGTESLQLLRDILQLADLVKFAKEQPLPMQHDGSLNNGIAFVNMTRPSMSTPVINEDSNPNDQPVS
jgi:hypothetical protein